MTILNNGTRNQYTATSGQTTFIYNFELFDQGDIVVYKNTVLLSIGTHYSVTGVGVATGGTIVLVTGATTGDTITIFRDTAAERLTDYQNSGDFLADEVNQDFDRLWAVVQEINTNQNRFLQTSEITEIPLPVTLEESVTGQILRWKDPNTIDSVSSSNITPTGSITTDYARHVTDYAALRLINTADYADGQVIVITNSGIGGEGVLRNVTAHGLTDNGGTIIVINADFYWQRNCSGFVNALWFEAVGDGTTDNALPIQSALDTGENVYLPSGNYYTTVKFVYTLKGQKMYGDGHELQNIATGTPSNGENITQIYTDQALDAVIEMPNLPGLGIKGIAINCNKVALKGLEMAQAVSPLIFHAEVEKIFINDAVNTALDTGYVVDTTFNEILINGFHESPAAVTDVGIRNGATNNKFNDCWIHGAQHSIQGIGTVANFFGCTFTSFPYNAANAHILVGGNISKYSFLGCYFETSPIVDDGGFALGVMSFSDCFLETQDSNLIDVTGATAGDLLLSNNRVHETSASANITANTPVNVDIATNGQSAITFSGTGNIRRIEGTFTPTVIGTSAAGTASYSSQSARYTKRGNRVWFDIDVAWTGGTGTGNLRLAGLPFTSNVAIPKGSITVGYAANLSWGASTTLSGYVVLNATQIEFIQINVGGGGAAAVAYSATGILTLSGTYTV